MFHKSQIYVKGTIVGLSLFAKPNAKHMKDFFNGKTSQSLKYLQFGLLLVAS
jgi:hypothetical protein